MTTNIVLYQVRSGERIRYNLKRPPINQVERTLVSTEERSMMYEKYETFVLVVIV